MPESPPDAGVRQPQPLPSSTGTSRPPASSMIAPSADASSAPPSAPASVGATHLSIRQTAPSVQSALSRHAVRHFDSPHLYGLHLVSFGVQAPAPSQVDGCVSTPSLHDVAPQVVLAPGNAQESTLTPSQRPPHAVPPPEHFGREPTGSPLVATHEPSEPGASQRAHCASHALPQQ